MLCPQRSCGTNNTQSLNRCCVRLLKNAPTAAWHRLFARLGSGYWADQNWRQTARQTLARVAPQFQSAWAHQLSPSRPLEECSESALEERSTGDTLDGNHVPIGRRNGPHRWQKAQSQDRLEVAPKLPKILGSAVVQGPHRSTSALQPRVVG